MVSKPHLSRLIKIQYLKSTIHAAFTRTLTTLYSNTLLCLLTTLQLTLLAHGKYVSALMPGKAAGTDARADGAGDGIG
jgi:hypothetical protein